MNPWIKAAILLLVLCPVIAGTVTLGQELIRSETRQAIAQSWGNTDAQYTATGTFNTNLLIATTNPDAVDCDAIVSSTVTDKELSRQLKSLGFETIQCMNHTQKLQ